MWKLFWENFFVLIGVFFFIAFVLVGAALCCVPFIIIALLISLIPFTWLRVLAFILVVIIIISLFSAWEEAHH